MLNPFHAFAAERKSKMAKAVGDQPMPMIKLKPQAEKAMEAEQEALKEAEEDWDMVGSKDDEKEMKGVQTVVEQVLRPR